MVRLGTQIVSVPTSSQCFLLVILNRKWWPPDQQPSDFYNNCPSNRYYVVVVYDNKNYRTVLSIGENDKQL